MGNVGSKAEEEGSSVYLRDQTRFSVAALSITNARKRTLLNITPNAFPATRYIARRDIGDDSVVEYVQDPETTDAPSFLPLLVNEDELVFNFTFILRQSQGQSPTHNAHVGDAVAADSPSDTDISGLTFIFTSGTKELDNLVTREFHADPNLHKNPNVELIGDYNTQGEPAVQCQWSWTWKPPRSYEDRGGGWRNTYSFVEYDSRAHRLERLATFSLWVKNAQRAPNSPKIPSPHLDIAGPQKLRVPSAQSVDSRVSDSDGETTADFREPKSPAFEPIPEDGLGLVPTMTNATTAASTLPGAGAPVKVDLNCQRPQDDVGQTEDGPLFRATMKSMEQRTGSMRQRWKKVLKRAEAALEAQKHRNETEYALMQSFRDASSSNANAVQPAIDHYFDKIATEILAFERQNATNLQRLIIDPISRLYNYDIKQAETKKKDFDDESREFYAYVGRYLGQRQDSLKDKKRAETDSKYQSKRRNFELKRFDYSSFMQDLHGGRKDQEVLSHLTRYADAQAKGYLTTAQRIEAMIPQLEALSFEVKEVDKEFQMLRTEREEKRRALEKSSKTYSEPDDAPSTQNQSGGVGNGVGRAASVAGLESTPRSINSGSGFKSNVNGAPLKSPAQSGPTSTPLGQAMPNAQPGSLPLHSPSQSSKFKGIRDMEEKDQLGGNYMDANAMAHRKEGLLWALSRPGSHVDPKGLNKQAWHKFWIVMDQGKLSEYTNWKKKVDLHMDPIDLRVASVREARNAERRFCFEVITPQYTRVYQAQTEEDMRSWISAINNALQSAVEGKGTPEPMTESLPGSTRRDIASVLTGKSTSLSHRSSHASSSASKPVSRHATTGDKPTFRIPDASQTGRLLQQVRDVDEGNKYCADCNSESKVEWVSINLGIILCIECSGIHRSLGTHITKVRSLTLDTISFTQDIIEILLTIGNRVSNMIWEAMLDRAQKPSPNSSREQRLRFITAKYSDRAYVQPISSTLSHYSTPDETFLASVKKNDVQNVLYALALRANPNTADRSRHTHPVHLALAAADPAAPSARATSPAPPSSSGGGRTTPTPPSVTTTAATSQGTTTRKPFTVAELLLQNGADLPTQLPLFPLSPAAQLYLEQKAEQRSGKRVPDVVEFSPHSTGPSRGGAGGDMLTALPSLQSPPPTTASMSYEEQMQQLHFQQQQLARGKERESKLQKRVSGSGRLTKPPSGT